MAPENTPHAGGASSVPLALVRAIDIVRWLDPAPVIAARYSVPIPRHVAIAPSACTAVATGSISSPSPDVPIGVDDPLPALAR